MSVTDNYTKILKVLRTDTFDDWKDKTNLLKEHSIEVEKLLGDWKQLPTKTGHGDNYDSNNLVSIVTELDTHSDNNTKEIVDINDRLKNAFNYIGLNSRGIYSSDIDNSYAISNIIKQDIKLLDDKTESNYDTIVLTDSLLTKTGVRFNNTLSNLGFSLDGSYDGLGLLNRSVSGDIVYLDERITDNFNLINSKDDDIRVLISTNESDINFNKTNIDDLILKQTTSFNYIGLGGDGKYSSSANNLIAINDNIKSDIRDIDDELKNLRTEHTNDQNSNDINFDNLRQYHIDNSNGQGARTISSSPPSGGADGDIWYRVGGAVPCGGGGSGGGDDTPHFTNNDLRMASSAQLGAIKVGANLTVDYDGTLNASGGDGPSFNHPTGLHVPEPGNAFSSGTTKHLVATSNNSIGWETASSGGGGGMFKGDIVYIDRVSHVLQHNLINATEAGSDQWHSFTVPSEIPSDAHALIITFESFSFETYVDMKFRSSKVSERIVSSSRSVVSSYADTTSDYNTLQFPYTSSFEVRYDMYLVNSGGSPGAIAVHIDGYISSTAHLAPSLSDIYPIGSIYQNATDDRNPNAIFGFGVWVAYGIGRVLTGVSVGVDGLGSEDEGGASTVTLTDDNIPGGNIFTTDDHKNAIQWSVDPNHSTNSFVGQSLPPSLRYTNGAEWPAGISRAPGNGSLPDIFSVKTGNAGTAESFSIVPRFKCVYMWKRTE
jgi:hypothetical protein